MDKKHSSLSFFFLFPPLSLSLSLSRVRVRGFSLSLFPSFSLHFEQPDRAREFHTCETVDRIFGDR